MALLPSTPHIDREDVEPRVIDFNGEAASAFSVLQSENARALLAALYDEPATASELADRVETSLQNAQYHLSNLRDADLVEVAGTGYSSRGNEMKVYAPSGDPLTLVIGPNDSVDKCREALDTLDRSGAGGD